MGARVELRGDFSARDLRALACKAKDSRQSRRLLALAAVAEGHRRGEAARIGGMDRQTLRDWVHRFNEEGPDGLINRKPAGPASKLSSAQKALLAEKVERGPLAAVDGVVRWRCKDLVAWVWDEFRIEISEATMGRVLKEMGFAHMSARPRHHAQNEHALEAFKKTSLPNWRPSAKRSARISR